MITKEEYLERYKKIQTRCKGEGLDAFLITSDDNLYYMTGKSCMPFERPFVVIVWPDKPATYMLPLLEREHMSAIKHIEDFVTYYEYPAPEELSWKTVLGKLLNGCKHIGTDLFTRSEIFSFLSEGMKVEALDWMYTQRYIKSDAEIELMSAIAEYTKKAMAGFIKSIRYGSLTIDSLNPASKAQQKALIDRKFDVDYYALKFQSAAWPAPKSAEPHSIPNILTEYREGPHVLSFPTASTAMPSSLNEPSSHPSQQARCVNTLLTCSRLARLCSLTAKLVIKPLPEMKQLVNTCSPKALRIMLYTARDTEWASQTTKGPFSQRVQTRSCRKG